MDQPIEKLVKLSMLLFDQIDKLQMTLLKERPLILYLSSCFLISLQDYILDHLKIASKVLFKLFVLFTKVVL